MFENYERAKHKKAPAWAMPLVVTGVVVHVALVMTMWIRSIWEVEKLELPKGRVSISGFQAPPPPPPLKAGKKPEDSKKPKEPPKKVVKEAVQPTIAPKQIVETAPGPDQELPDCPPGANCDPDAPDGGAADGTGTEAQPTPPPPPPPPAPPQNVAPTAVEANRISGDKMIQPDDVTKTEIGRSGKAKIVASYKICLSTSGAISSVSQLKSSGFPAYDTKLQREMKSGWKYRPFMVNGKAAPVCTAVTFVYSQK